MHEEFAKDPKWAWKRVLVLDKDEHDKILDIVNRNRQQLGPKTKLPLIEKITVESHPFSETFEVHVVDKQGNPITNSYLVSRGHSLGVP